MTGEIRERLRERLAGRSLEDRVLRVLRLRGYEVEHDVTLAGTQVDMVAAVSDGLSETQFVVECNGSGRPIGIQTVKEKFADIADLPDESAVVCLLFVSTRGFTREARDFARNRARLVLRTLDELESDVLNLRPLREAYLYEYEQGLGIFVEANLYASYVPLAARRYDALRSIPEDLQGAVIQWLADAKPILFLLGEYGSGKTSFVRHFAYELLNAQNEPDLYPVLINLRDYNSAAHMKELVTDTLLNTYGVKMPTFGAFQAMARSGKIVLILDGFDEMMSADSAGATTASLAQIHALAALGTRIIVTCRSNFFSSHEHLLELVESFELSREGGSSAVENANETDRPFAGLSEVLFVSEFDEKQIRLFVEQNGLDAEQFIGEMSGIHDLSDLSTRPVLLRMIVETLPSLLERSDQRINSAALYDAYTRRWSLRDEWRVSLDATTRTQFCEALACAMHRARKRAIGHSELEDLISKTVGMSAQVPEQLDRFIADIQICSFLIRSGSTDQFFFAHKSFIEYFVAGSLASILAAEREPTGEMMAEPASDSSIDEEPWIWGHTPRGAIEIPDSRSELVDLVYSRSLGGPFQLPRLKIPIAWNDRAFQVFLPKADRDKEELDPLVIALRDAALGAWERSDSEESVSRSYLVRQLSGASAFELDVTPEIATFTVETLVLQELSVVAAVSAATENSEVGEAWVSVLELASQCTIQGTSLERALIELARHHPASDLGLSSLGFLGRSGCLSSGVLNGIVADDLVLNDVLVALCIRNSLPPDLAVDMWDSKRLSEFGKVAVAVASQRQSEIALGVIDGLLQSRAIEPRALGATALQAISHAGIWTRQRVEQVVTDAEFGVNLRLAVADVLLSDPSQATENFAIRLSGRTSDKLVKKALLRISREIHERIRQDQPFRKSTDSRSVARVVVRRA